VDSKTFVASPLCEQRKALVVKYVFMKKELQGRTTVGVVVAHEILSACWHQQEKNHMKVKMLENDDDHEQRKEVWTIGDK
jgi:hypothetical protein